MENSKIIGVGFHKTGTTTLGTCLKTLGFNHLSCNREAFFLYLDSQTEALLKLMEHFDSFEDWPWPFLFREAHERFPGSKFLLTTRSDPEVWFSSLSRHVNRGAAPEFSYRKYIYGYEFPDDNKDLHIRKYREHNKAVRNFFADKPDQFLELCWENGDGWEKLCSFLRLPAPERPIPMMNQDPANKDERMPWKERFRTAARVLVHGTK